MASPRTTAAPARPALATALLVALPGVLVGLAGLLHPLFLTPGTADRWRLAHLLLLPGFPLVGVALWAVLRDDRGPLATGARLLAAAYAVLYSALDSIAGIGAPSQVLGTVRRGEPFPPIGDLYGSGDRLGHLGVVALGASALLAGAALYARSRSPLALVGAVLVVAACPLFYRHHVFAPWGVLALVVVGLGTGLLELARPRRDATPA